MNRPERNHEKPLRKWYDTCSNPACKEKYEIGPNNAYYAHYALKPECNFLVCACPTCETSARIYDDALSPDDARARGIEILDDEDCPSDYIFNEWLQIKGLEPPQQYELTARQERLITSFSSTIGTLMARDEQLFWDCMTDDTKDQPYPARWV